MRAYLALMLCFMIAFQGVANANVFKQPCPMQQGMEHMASDATVGAGSCCNDADTAAKTGKLCKTGQECSLSTSAIMSLQTTLLDPMSSPQVVTTLFMTPALHPSAVWRPPSFS